MYDERCELMEGIRYYILSFVCAAIICSIIKLLVARTGKIASLMNIVCGLFIGITALSPIMDFKLPDYNSNIQNVYETANQISQEAVFTTREDIAGIITEETQAYILEKASSLDMDVVVEVNLNEEDLIPESVVVVGPVAPYEKKLLANYIQQTLDIPEERQQWKN